LVFAFRLVSCKYEKIGCHWQGTLQAQVDHEERCAQARKTGLEIMENLEETCKEEETKLTMYQSIFALLSFGRTSVHGIIPYNENFEVHF
jgi:succinate dehydrogenase/fumarate reductase flavoprotein subunit